MVVPFRGALPAESVAVFRSMLAADVPEHAPPRELLPLLVSAVRAHPDFEPSLYPAAFSGPAFHRYRTSTRPATELARPLVGTDPALRADVSVLLWLSEKTAYAGGDVLIDDGGAVTRWTGEPGDAIGYAAGSRQSVEPITRGELLVCVLDVQSLVAGQDERRILFDFHRALMELEKRPLSARHAQTIRRAYSGLVRMWAELPRQR
ncbi:MAG: hypothetical protein FWD17_17620, partial [Polyangiaceae bacterium]|nr:hypothetical protein [Polyangiaceae bacterium]